jgi:hypothetical protein
MGNGTSIGKFNGLTTAGGGVCFDVGALGGNANALICNPDALSAGPEILRFDPDALSFDPDALRFDTGALRFDPETLSFDRDALSFEVFHQRRGSNGLISSDLRGIASKPSKFAFFQTLNIQQPTLN